jgi:sec-independent protein translocase protein TatA
VLNNLGFGEILLIVIVALIFFGPSKLPEMGRSVGQAIREFKKATQAITEEVAKAATEEIAEKNGSAEKKA